MASSPLCLDTNVLIGYLKGREPAASAVVRAIQEHTCWVTAVTTYELLFGVARAQRQIGEEALLANLRIAPLDGPAAQRAAHLHDELIRQNRDIGIKDILIAAICLEHSLPLLTLNAQHFSRVPGLQVISPQGLLSPHAEP